MGGILSSSKSDELLEYKPFIKLAEKVMDENGKDLEALEKCVNDVDAVPITLRCEKEMHKWNTTIIFNFCKVRYDNAVKCQKNAGDNWASDCRQETTHMLACGDDASNRLYRFNLQKQSEKASKA